MKILITAAIIATLALVNCEGDKTETAAPSPPKEENALGYDPDKPASKDNPKPYYLIITDTSRYSTLSYEMKDNGALVFKQYPHNAETIVWPPYTIEERLMAHGR